MTNPSYKLVPVEPTEDMIDAGLGPMLFGTEGMVRSVFAAMLASAPHPASGETDTDWPSLKDLDAARAKAYRQGKQWEVTDAIVDDIVDAFWQSLRPVSPSPVPAETSGWQAISDEARGGQRILLLWKPVGGLKEHVELGWWTARTQGWCNTYGKPFHDEPDAWAPLAPFTALQSQLDTGRAAVLEEAALIVETMRSQYGALVMRTDATAAIRALAVPSNSGGE